MTITEFMLARIAEDESDAMEMAALRADGSDDPDWPDIDGYAVSGRMIRVAQHVLAECEAKRRIMARHSPHERLRFAGPGQMEAVGWDCDWCEDGYQQNLPYPCPDVQDLALIYSDHPDFDSAWRP